jgi:hypothetical protein
MPKIIKVALVIIAVFSMIYLYEKSIHRKINLCTWDYFPQYEIFDVRCEGADDFLMFKKLYEGEDKGIEI